MAPRGLRLAFALAAAASSAPAADAQFLRGVFGKGDGSTSSYFSSSTWTFGQDGQMHEKVQKMSSEVMDTPNGPQRVEKKLVCKDGNCREEMVIQSAGGPGTEAMVMPPSFGMGFRARAIMERLMGRQRGPSSPVIEVVAFPGPTPERKPELVEMMSPETARPMALRGMLQRLVGGPSKYVNVEVVPTPPPVSSSYMPPVHDITGALLLSGLIASSTLLATLVAAFRLQRSASARELPLHGALAEPLASAEGAAPSGQAAAAKKEKAEDSALTSTRCYLKGLYTQAIAKAEHQAIAQYLSTVYARATA